MDYCPHIGVGSCVLRYRPPFFTFELCSALLAFLRPSAFLFCYSRSHVLFRPASICFFYVDPNIGPTLRSRIQSKFRILLFASQHALPSLLSVTFRFSLLDLFFPPPSHPGLLTWLSSPSKRPCRSHILAFASDTARLSHA